MSNERKTFQSFKTFQDTEPIVTQLTDEEAGRIFKACYGCYFRGETLEFRSDDDRMFRGAWGTFEMKLLSERKKDLETSEKRSIAGREGGLANAKNKKQESANAPTYTDTVTETNSSTNTISFTGTNTEHACAVPVDRQAASAAAVSAEPPAGDLFSFKKIKVIVKKNKINLTEEGIQIFYEEMQENDWMLYDTPVEKKFITRTLREWAKKHPEYGIESDTEQKAESQKEEQSKKVFKHFKQWLRYYGYDSNYDQGFGEYDEEISIDAEMIEDVWRADDLSESMADINKRLINIGYGKEEIIPLMQLFKKYSRKE